MLKLVSRLWAYHWQCGSQIKVRGVNCDPRAQIKLRSVRTLLHHFLEQLAQEEVDDGAACCLCGCSNGPDQGEDEQALQHPDWLKWQHLYVAHCFGLIEEIAIMTQRTDLDGMHCMKHVFLLITALINNADVDWPLFVLMRQQSRQSLVTNQVYTTKWTFYMTCSQYI